MAEQSGATVSHEAIYRAVYALPHGELRRELIGCLHRGKPLRGSKPKGSERRGKLCNMTNIKDRPEGIEGRLVPGHWESDLILAPAGPVRLARWWNARPVSLFWCIYRRARLTSQIAPLPVR